MEIVYQNVFGENDVCSQKVMYHREMKYCHFPAIYLPKADDRMCMFWFLRRFFDISRYFHAFHEFRWLFSKLYGIIVS